MKDRRAFSLTELLVVMAIIAVLMAMMVPVALKAWRQAKALFGHSGFRQRTKLTNRLAAHVQKTGPGRFETLEWWHGRMLDEAGAYEASRLAGLDAGT